MKKALLFLGVVALFVATGCNKEKDCSCTTTMDGIDPIVVEVTIDEGECSDGNTTTDVGGGLTSTVECVEK